MIAFPPAKINIGLNITGRRPDGYHELQTLMMAIPCSDVLEIVESASGRDSLVCTGRGVDCPMEKNLVWRALQAMRREYDIPPVEMHLDKRTPDGAGLGGGSADAAYTLRALRTMFAPEVSDFTLARTAATLGADCPFFIYDTPMYCTGTGTEMTPMELPALHREGAGLWIAVVKPEVSVSTREAYAGVRPRVPSEPLCRLLTELPIEQWQGRVVNDFEQSIFPRFPQIRRVKERLLEAGAVYASMSGSGSAVYGLFLSKPDERMVKPFDGEGCYLLERFA